MQKKFELQDRLITFASDVINVAERLPKEFSSNYIATQLIRSSTSPALNYGEVQAAESRADFIHKMKICLKELRESFNSLCLIQKQKWHDHERLNTVLKENNELISIFVASIKTAQKNKATPKSTTS